MCRDYQTRMAFWSRNQLPFFMVWREYFYGNEQKVIHAVVLFNSLDWIGF